ncbi:MAG: hypothetical protein Q8P51_04125 [Ignavibacteria bacterium]|nr:hypothetical protein [Ignavibacteria bacterium]
MNNAEKSLFVFGLYLIFAVGLGFMVVPTMLLDMFGLKYGDDTWIRFVGMLASIIGVYYLVAVKLKLTQLFIWTVWMRYYAAAFMVATLLLGKTGLPILMFAGIDALAATWTLVALKK